MLMCWGSQTPKLSLSASSSGIGTSASAMYSRIDAHLMVEMGTIASNAREAFVSLMLGALTSHLEAFRVLRSAPKGNAAETPVELDPQRNTHLTTSSSTSFANISKFANRNHGGWKKF